MSGLSEGTIETYLGYAGAPRRCRAYRAAALAHADADCQHAHDVEAEKLQQIIKSQSDPCFQALLWLMFATGSRNKDICRLRHSQIKLNYKLKCTSVEYRLTKNLRKRSTRRVITVPWKWRMPPPAQVALFLTKDSSDRPFRRYANVSCTNAKIKESDAGRKVTTYSFRRNFMQFLDSKFESAEERMKYSMHASHGILEAHYQKDLFER